MRNWLDSFDWWDALFGWVLAPISAVVFITIAVVGVCIGFAAVIWWFIFVFGCLFLLIGVGSWDALIEFLTLGKV